MDDEQILERGGTENDIEEYAKANGADLTEKDFPMSQITKEENLLTLKTINLGRNKLNRTAEVDITFGLVHDTVADTVAHVASQYLMSDDVSAEESEEKGLYSIFAGGRNVGSIQVLR